MFGWILWALRFSLNYQDMNGQDNGVTHCEPQNVKVHNFIEEQGISLIWEDDPSCSAKIHEQLIYEVEVMLPEDIILHKDDIVVLPDQTGTAHSWNWTSPLPLESVSHSVRLHPKYKNHTGRTSSNKPHVFPRDRVVEVGSNLTFYCILGAEWKFEKMDFRQYSKTQKSITKISDGIYAMTAHLPTPSGYGGTDVICNEIKYGATIYIGYPPGDMNLTCETQDLESVECYWSEGRHTHLYNDRSTYYLLNGRHCPGVCKEKCKCNLPSVQVDVGENTWTLKAQNPLGMVELTDKADLSKRVHMLAPVKVTASIVNARNVSLKWQWTAQRYNTLHLECQVRLNYNGQVDTRNDSGSGLDLTVLNGLIPKQTYTVQIRCRATQHFWKWGRWSEISTFDTRGDVPDVLDVWMLLKSNQTIITWKTPLANQSHGQIIDYELTWGNTIEKERKKRTVSPPLKSTALSLDTNEEHIVTVTARNSYGSSPPSAITVPRLYPEQVINSSKIIGSNGGFDLSWSISPVASCGYVVDWCPTFSDECRVEWMNVPAGVTEARIFSENFNDGVRYTLSIFSRTQGAPELLERREGYIKETNDPEASHPATTSGGEGDDRSLTVPMNPLTENPMVGVIISLATVFTFLSLVTILCYRNWTCVKQKIYPPIPKPVFTDGWLTQLDDAGRQILKVAPCPHSEVHIVDAPELCCTVEPENDGFNQEEGPLIITQMQSPKGYNNQPLKKSIPAPLTLIPKTISSPTGSPSHVSTSMIENLTYNIVMQTTEHTMMEQLEESPQLLNIMSYVSLERNSCDNLPHCLTEPCTPAQGQNDPESHFSISSTYLLIPDSSSK